MHINIIRSIESPFCLGRLLIDGHYFCDTLEPPYFDAEEVELLKNERNDIGNIAIPYGNYTIDMTIVSPRFRTRSWAAPYGGIVPTVVGVKGRSRILIHPGNNAYQYGGDTAGCILVGDYNARTAMLVSSVATYHELVRRLFQCHSHITLCVSKA